MVDIDRQRVVQRTARSAKSVVHCLCPSLIAPHLEGDASLLLPSSRCSLRLPLQHALEPGQRGPDPKRRRSHAAKRKPARRPPLLPSSPPPLLPPPLLPSSPPPPSPPPLLPSSPPPLLPSSPPPLPASHPPILPSYPPTLLPSYPPRLLPSSLLPSYRVIVWHFCMENLVR
jgi:hypothetical protein